MEAIKSARTIIYVAMLIAMSHKHGSCVTGLSTAPTSAEDSTKFESTTSSTKFEPTTSLSSRATTTSSAVTTMESSSVEFHTIMIVMIVLLGVIIVFSLLCGFLTIFGVDIGCPIPCCGSGGSKAKSTSSISLKMSSKKSRNFSSQHLNESEDHQEFDFGSNTNTSRNQPQDNKAYDVYETEASPPYVASSITFPDEDPISISL